MTRPLSQIVATASALLLAAACAAGGSSTGGSDDDGGQQAGSGGSGGAAGSGGAGGIGGDASGTGGAGPPRAPVAGELVISEFMPQPMAVSEDDGEWLELANVSNEVLDLDGCRIHDLNVPPDEVFFGAGTLVPPGGRVVAAKSSQPTLNGGLDGAVLAYGMSFTLDNDSDEIVLACATGTIDQIAYDATWPWSVGASAQLRATALDAQANDAAGSWCTAASSYGLGDMGTPGAAETSCP